MGNSSSVDKTSRVPHYPEPLPSETHPPKKGMVSFFKKRWEYASHPTKPLKGKIKLRSKETKEDRFSASFEKKLAKIEKKLVKSFKNNNAKKEIRALQDVKILIMNSQENLKESDQLKIENFYKNHIARKLNLPNEVVLLDEQMTNWAKDFNDRLQLLQYASTHPQEYLLLTEAISQADKNKFIYRNAETLTTFAEINRFKDIPKLLENEFAELKNKMIAGLVKNKGDLRRIVTESNANLPALEDSQRFKKVLKEFESTEITFSETLKLISDEDFLESLQPFINPDESKFLSTLFIQAADSSEALTIALKDLSKLPDNEARIAIRDLLLTQGFEQHLEKIEMLVKNHEKIQSIFAKVQASDEGKRLIEEFEKKAAGNGPGTPKLSQYLIQPMQRLPRYAMLVRELDKSAKAGKPYPLQDGFHFVLALIEHHTRLANDHPL